MRSGCALPQQPESGRGRSGRFGEYVATSAREEWMFFSSLAGTSVAHTAVALSRDGTALEESPS